MKFTARLAMVITLALSSHFAWAEHLPPELHDYRFEQGRRLWVDGSEQGTVIQTKLLQVVPVPLANTMKRVPVRQTDNRTHPFEQSLLSLFESFSTTPGFTRPGENPKFSILASPGQRDGSDLIALDPLQSKLLGDDKSMVSITLPANGKIELGEMKMQAAPFEPNAKDVEHLSYGAIEILNSSYEYSYGGPTILFQLGEGENAKTAMIPLPPGLSDQKQAELADKLRELTKSPSFDPSVWNEIAKPNLHDPVMNGMPPDDAVRQTLNAYRTPAFPDPPK